MADGAFNNAKGRAVELYRRVQTNDPANSGLVVVLLTVNEADATLEDYDDLSTLLAQAGNTEANFTGYTRQVLTDVDLAAAAPDDTNNRYDVDIPDQTWASAGGAVNNTMTKLLICYDPDVTGGDDTTIEPIAHYDFTPTTDGVSDVVATINAAGFYRAA